MERSRRTWRGILAAGVLFVAACASSTADTPGAARTTAATTPGPGSGSAASTPPAGSEVGGDGTDGGASTTIPGGTATSAPTGSTTTETTAAAPTPGPVGAFAPYYLRATTARRIVVDVRSQAGAAPRQASLDHVASVLRAVSDKTVDVVGGEVPGGGHQWTAADIRSLADTTGTASTADDAVVHLFFLAGGFAGDDQVLGISVRSDVAAVFSDRVDQAAGLLADPGRIEAAVSMHEVGHLLGLVDLFLSTGRADPDHPGHSRNRGSVMYYAVESTLVASLLGGGPPVDFDADDLADLATIRSG